METKPAAKDEQCYEDFEPFCQWKKEEEYDILGVHLPGFKRQDVRVQINNRGILTISGKQPTDEETTPTRSRFRKEIKISKNRNANGIRAKFSHGILSIMIPKKVANLSTQIPEHSKESAGSGNLLGFRSKVLRPKLSKEIALKTMVVALGMALGGYAIYRYPNSSTVQNN